MGNEINVTKRAEHVQQIAEANSVEINKILNAVAAEVDPQYPSCSSETNEPSNVRQYCHSSPVVDQYKYRSSVVDQRNPVLDSSDSSDSQDSQDSVMKSNQQSILYKQVCQSKKDSQSQTPKSFDSSCFVCSRELGSGGSAHVFLCKNIHTNEHYALKEIPRNHGNGKSSKMNQVLFSREKKVLQLLNHPNIVKYHESFMNEISYYIALEYCSGGTLMEKVKKNTGIKSENKAAYVIRSMLKALKYMHSKNVAHRDIKCSNIVFAKGKNDKKPIVKLIDFGNAEEIKNGNERDTIGCGTPHYMAPEICNPFRTKQDLYKADMWSLGVVCYALVAGCFPFVGNGRDAILYRALHTRFKWPNNCKISSPCKDFISKLLTVNARKRMSAEDAFCHEWIAFNGYTYGDVDGNYPKLQDFSKLVDALS